MTLYGIAVDGWKQVEPRYGMPTDNFCVDGRFHIGIRRDVPVPGTGWHVSVLPFCPCASPVIVVSPEIFMESVAKVTALIGKPLNWLGPSAAGVYHWEEIRKLRAHV